MRPEADGQHRYSPGPNTCPAGNGVHCRWTLRKPVEAGMTRVAALRPPQSPSRTLTRSATARSPDGTRPRPRGKASPASEAPARSPASPGMPAWRGVEPDDPVRKSLRLRQTSSGSMPVPDAERLTPPTRSSSGRTEAADRGQRGGHLPRAFRAANSIGRANPLRCPDFPERPHLPVPNADSVTRGTPG